MSPRLLVCALVAFATTLPVSAQTFTNASNLLPDGLVSGGFGGGAVVDVDGDGRTDLANTHTLLLQRDGGFEPVAFDGAFPLGSIHGDVDGDGLLDVLVLEAQEPEIYRYTPAHEALRPFTGRGGLNISIPLVQGSVLLDYDRDGTLDVLLGNDVGIDFLLRGLGDGAFADVSSEALPQLNRGDYGMMAADYDRDGDTDVYVGLCAGTTENLLYRNDDGVFSEVAPAADVDDARATWGVAWLDYDNDGWLDLFASNMPSHLAGTNGLFHNNADGTFTDVATEAGVAGPTEDNSWTVTASDFDNDGWVDLFVVNDPEGSRLFRNNADGTFTDITTAARIPSLVGLPVASGDVDGDGWSDLYMPAARDNRGQTFDALLLNDGGTNGWLTVDLTGVASNRDGVGARVEVAAGDLSMVREITAGDGFMAQSHGLRAHFGLGTATTADVTIRWPSGTVETISGVAANQAITVVEGLGLNGPPAMFGLTSPANGAAVPLGEAVTLAWDAATDPEAGAVSYTVHLASPDGADTTFETAEPTLTVPATMLSPEGEYRWAVVASDGHTPRTSLDPFRFTNNPDVASQAGPERDALSLEVWPNPARTEATVAFELETTESVWLEVYDALGRRVERSALGVRGAGAHAAQLDLGRYPAGMYVLRLFGGRGEVATVRMMRMD
ncbi:MAG: FG-GAP-like repeat-containing protein [Rhodothermales bacterium]